MGKSRSQLMLERHVNGHFNSDGSPNGSAKKSMENGASKLYKRNGKRIRFRRQPWSGTSLLIIKYLINYLLAYIHNFIKINIEDE